MKFNWTFFDLQLLEAQAAYHKKALMAIEGMIPKMKAVIGQYIIDLLFFAWHNYFYQYAGQRYANKRHDT